MALSRNLKQCANVGGTIKQLQEIMFDSPVEIIMLAAGQHGLNIAFTDVLQDPSLRTFICSVQLGNLLEGCMGYGPTKKEAKMNAAEEAITELVNSLKDLSPSSSHSPKSKQAENTTWDGSLTSKRTNSFPSSSELKSKKGTASSLIDLYQSLPSRQSPSLRGLSARGPPASPMNGNLIGTFNNDNPIGTLKELADKNGWPSPVYDEVDDYGEDHKKTFVVQCKFRDLISEGIANNKKTAKKQSAEEMLTLIGQNETPAKKSHSSSESYQARRMRSSAAMDRILGLPSTSHVTTHVTTPLKELERRASKRKCTVKWHEDIGTGYSGNSLCFVRISTDPVTVCAGSGPTANCARDDAARNALKIFKYQEPGAMEID